MENKVRILIESGKTISTMESCTGGLLASTITDYSGASEIFSGAFVTYSNSAKIAQNVAKEVIDAYGVYSVETATAMARVCAAAYDVDIGIGITGSLGRKDPNNSDSEVGKVYYCISMDGTDTFAEINIPDELTSRHEMKEYVVNEVLDKIVSLIN